MTNVLESMEVESAPTIFKTEHEDEEEADENCPADLTAQEIALSIDHILEQILSLLEAPDLLTCRLVSHRFLKFSRCPLRKRVHKRFIHRPANSFNGEDSSGRTLSELINFLKQSASASASAESNPNLVSFPCSDFTLDGTTLVNKNIQQFLNICGSHVRQLSLDPIFPLIQDRTIENTFMEQLCNLLTVQTPHLEKLCITAYIDVQWEKATHLQHLIDENPCFRIFNFPLENSDPEFQQICSRMESLPRKSSLKFLNISGIGLTKTIEMLFQLSPKLQEIVIEQDYYYHTLLKPVNRLYLLKSLVFKPELQEDNYTTFNIDTMEKISLDKNLRLRELKICFREVYYHCHNDRQVEHRLVLMINRILESSKDTLEVLSLSFVIFLRRPGLQMPKLMPKLQEIQINVCFFEEALAAYAMIFPMRFSWMETFPNLTFVALNYSPEYYKDVHFYEFLKCLECGGNGEESLHLGIKTVVLDQGWSRIWSVTTIPSFISHRIRKLFPNASIEFTLC